MAWNYRIVKTKDNGSIRYGVHEVYYGSGGEDLSCDVTQKELDALGISWSEHPVALDNYSNDDSSEECTISDLKNMITLMMDAFNKPVIDGIEGG